MLARERFDNKDNLHRVESRVNGEWKEIYLNETEIATKGFSGLTPDYKHLVVKTFDDDLRRWTYSKMALADGKIEGPIFSHPDKDVEAVITGLDRVVHGVRYSGFVPTYEFFDKKLNARMRGIAKAVPDASFYIRDFTPNFDNIVFYMDGNQSSGDYLLYRDGMLSPFAQERPEITPEHVHKVTAYEYKARDGMTIPSLLTLPNGKEAKDLPAIMYPHGGPESYDQKGFDYFAQYFASKGYAVIQPQFRGSTGFGNAHKLAGRGEWGRKMQDDLTDAVNDLAKRGIIDSDKVCIVGASYGGYAALAGATFTPDVYQCAVSINGVSDVERMMKTDRREFGKHHWVVSYWERVIAKGNVSEDHIAAISPVNFAHKVDIPVLLLHGERDLIVKVQQSELMYEALKDADKDVVFIELEKGDHYLIDAQNRMLAMKAIDTFVSQHLQ